MKLYKKIVYIQTVNNIFMLIYFIDSSIDQYISYILGCDPGQYYNQTELQCEMCLPGTYSPSGDNCIDCPEWQTTSDEGSTSSDDCQNSKKLSIQINTPQNTYLISKIQYNASGFW